MPLITEGNPNLSEVHFGDLSFELTPENHSSAINKDIYIDNYGGVNKDTIVTMCFLYKEERGGGINKFTLKFTGDDNHLFEGSVLIVGGGGGGGYNIGGGGGGGEVIYIDSISFKPGINYNIVVGKGGDKGTREYYHGDSGYNSGLNDILAKGGGGGASYVYDNPFNLINEDRKLNFPKEVNGYGRGLDGGSGGGGCGFQYKINTNTPEEPSANKSLSENSDIINSEEYKKGKKTVLKNPISAFENYYSFGNDGGVGNGYEYHAGTKLYRTRGGGGGGAGFDKVGENAYDNLDNPGIPGTVFGCGGHGIAVEEINLGTGNQNFCPLLYNDLECTNTDIVNTVTKETTTKLRTIINEPKNYLYWGGGGGAGSFNRQPGNGGKGGGGGGGYYEAINVSGTEPLNRGQIEEGTYITFAFDEEIDAETNHIGLSSKVPLTDNNKDSNIAKGGDGIPHTGGGGGGGGLSSMGGNGGSGIVIIMLKTRKKQIEVEEPEYTLDDLDKILSEFDNNKKEFGKNLSELYNYNIKEHKEFFDYIDHIYEDNILEKNIPHRIIKDPNKNIKKDSNILKYNYDRDIYDVKFHQYLKIIFDLRINYDSFLLYSKIKNSGTPNPENLGKFDLNEKLFDYQRLIFIIIDIIENIIILIRNDKNYYEFINNIDTLELKLLEKNNGLRETYNLKQDLSELENDIELIKIKITETQYEIKKLKKKEDQGENTKNEIKKLEGTEQTLEDILKSKEQDKTIELGNDLYYTFYKHNDEKILKFYISKKNNFQYHDSINQEDKPILSSELFRKYNIREIKLKELLKYNNIKELIKEEYDEDNDVQLIVKIYIYSLLKIKKQNFLKNILTQYIFMSYANILQSFYKESEEFLLEENLFSYVKTRQEALCTTTLYANLGKFDYVVERMKSLLGYSFINEYIDGYKINTAKIISSSCPYLKISLNNYDADKIILLLFRKSKNDSLFNCDDDTICDLVENIQLTKYKEHYKNLKESFLLEIENNRYNIHDFNFKKDTVEHSRNIIEFTIDDRYNKICNKIYDKDENGNTIDRTELKDIYILSKDSSHINDIYDTDVELLEKYNKKLETQKKELDNINDKYGKYKYHYEKLKYKNNIYYFVLFLILVVVIILNIAGINSYMKTLTYLIILAILVILIIYNYFTKVNLSIVEKFEGNKKGELFYDYYNISTASVISRSSTGALYRIKIRLMEHDKYKLKIRKFKNLDENTDNYINNLVIKHLRIKYGDNIEEIVGVTIDDADSHYYYITHITFEHNKDITDTEIKNIVLVKNDKSIIKELLSDITNYHTISIDDRTTLCRPLSDPLEEPDKSDIEAVKVRNNKKNIYIYTVRNDLLRYINNKFINIKKIIESIELEKANNLANKVHKNLTNEKENLLDYQKQYESKKLKNININNLYKHEIIGQSAFINFIILFIIILILLLILANIFPTKIFIIMIIGFPLICANIYNYVLNSSYRTRKDASKKYW